MEGDSTAINGSPKWVPSDNSTYLSHGRLLPEGGDAMFTGIMVSSEIPAGEPSVAAMPGGEGVPTGNPVSREKFNAEIKCQLMKEIRRFGRSKYWDHGYTRRREVSLFLLHFSISLSLKQ